MNEIHKKAVAHVVKMLEGKSGEVWNGDYATYEGVCGWNGVMSPLNKPAFISKFGTVITETIEKAAREELAARAAFWENSKAKRYEQQANELISASASALNVGDFVWGVMNNLKCDHENFRTSIREIVADTEDGVMKSVRLCKITRIEEVEDIEKNVRTVLKGWQVQGEEGGSRSDDVSDEELGENFSNYTNLNSEQQRTFYTMAVLVRDKQERYFLIDPEGYDYPRYVILPKKWEAIFAATVKEIKAEIAAEKEAYEQAKADAQAKARAEYDARCAKWEGMMEELPTELRGHMYLKDARKIGKRNVLKMAKKVFPWVAFTISYDGGWGHGYTLKWKNGPTIDEVRTACDFDLFMPSWDTFDGMTDCAGSEQAAFRDFSDKFGGVCNGVKCHREECEKDNNGNPNGSKPTPPNSPYKAENGSVEIRENEAKKGIEIYFAGIPSDKVRDFMKSHEWRWSKFARCWWHKATDEARKTAEEIVKMWNEENNLVAA